MKQIIRRVTALVLTLFMLMTLMSVGYAIVSSEVREEDSVVLAVRQQALVPEDGIPEDQSNTLKFGIDLVRANNLSGFTLRHQVDLIERDENNNIIKRTPATSLFKISGQYGDVSLASLKNTKWNSDSGLRAGTATSSNIGWTITKPVNRDKMADELIWFYILPDKNVFNGEYELYLEPQDNQDSMIIGGIGGSGKVNLQHNLGKDGDCRTTFMIEDGIDPETLVPKNLIITPDTTGGKSTEFAYGDTVNWAPLTASADKGHESAGEVTYKWYYTESGTEHEVTDGEVTTENGRSICTPDLTNFKPGMSREYYFVATNEVMGMPLGSTSEKVTFSYNKATLSDSVWTVTGDNAYSKTENNLQAPYTGNPYTLTHTWKDNSTLAEGFKIFYDGSTTGTTEQTHQQTNVGKYSAKLEADADGNYEGTSQFNWEIIPGTIEAQNDLTAEIPIYATSRTPKNISDLINPKVADKSTLKYTVTDNSGKFEITNNNAANAAIVCKTGVTDNNQVYNVQVHVEDTASNYNSADFTLKMKIMQSSPAIVEVTANALEFTYGDEIPDDFTSQIEVKAWVDNNGEKGDEITNEPDVRIEVGGTEGGEDIKDAGTHKVKVQWTGTHEGKPYSGTGTFEVKVNQKPVSALTAKTGQVYDGTEKSAFDTVDNKVYTVSGDKAINAGSYTATVKLASTNYKWNDGATGDKTVNWKIEKAIGSGTGADFPISKSDKNKQVDPSKMITLEGKTFGDLVSISKCEKIAGEGNGPLSKPAEISSDKKTIILDSLEDVKKEQTVTYQIVFETENYSAFTLTLKIVGQPLKTAYFSEADFADREYKYQGTGLADKIEKEFMPVPEPKGTGTPNYTYTYYKDLTGEPISNEEINNVGEYYMSIKYTDDLYEANGTKDGLKRIKITVKPLSGLEIKNEGEIDFGTKVYDGTTEIKDIKPTGTVVFEGLNGTDSIGSNYTITTAVAVGADVGDQKVTYTVKLTDTELVANYGVTDVLTGTNGKLKITAYEIKNYTLATPDKIYTISDDTNLTLQLNNPEIKSPVTQNPLNATAQLVLSSKTGNVKVTLNDKNHTIGPDNTWTSGNIDLVKDANIATNPITNVYYGDTLPAPTAKIFGADVTGTWYNGSETASSSVNQALAVFQKDGAAIYALVSVSPTSRPTVDDEDDNNYGGGSQGSSSGLPNVSSGSGNRPMGRPGSTTTKPSGTTNPTNGKPLTNPNGTNPPAQPEQPGQSTEQPGQSGKVFTDTANHWSKDAVAFVTERNLFQGTSADKFSPETAMNRAMLVTVLARLDGADTTGGANWYEPGVKWAKEKGVSDGKNPLNNVTRQELATMLWRYASKPEASGDLSKFKDANGVSDWAVDAMRWATQSGIITGKGNGVLAPGAYATRAEVATMIMRFVNLMNA